jgi:hypothetical protein
MGSLCSYKTAQPTLYTSTYVKIEKYYKILTYIMNVRNGLKLLLNSLNSTNLMKKSIFAKLICDLPLRWNWKNIGQIMSIIS